MSVPDQAAPLAVLKARLQAECGGANSAAAGGHGAAALRGAEGRNNTGHRQTPHPSAEALLDAYLAEQDARAVVLYPAQEEALLALASDSHVILATPTGSGKSLVAEFHHFLSWGRGRRSWYTSPIKALVHEKFFALCRRFGAEHVGLLTGDASINRDAPILCATAEVLASVVLDDQAAKDVDDVIMDEFHYYGDQARGTAWQLPLLLLKHSQFLLMSATLGDVTQLKDNIAATTVREVTLVQSHERPVPLDFAWSEVPLQEQLLGLVAGGKAPIYVVHFSQREALESAQATLSVELASKEDKTALKAAVAHVRFDSPFGPTMRRLLLQAIGLHHAGLLPKYRLLVEQLAQAGLLKVIMGTDTLGVGINVPIRTVLFSKLCKYDGQGVGVLTVREFRQIAGRAGRKGFDAAGSVIAQAPEHVIDNRRMESRVLGDAKKLRKLVRKKPPAHNYVPWDQNTFARLQSKPAETVRSQFRLSYHLLCTLLRNRENGCRALQHIINLCHETPAKKRFLRREARRMVKTLMAAGVCEPRRLSSGQRTLSLGAALGDDFSLTHALALFVIDALPLFDEQSDTYALDVLSLIESILDSPAVILRQEVSRKKDEAAKALRAEGKSFEERVAELDAITHDKPCEDLLYPRFNLWLTHNPWAGDITLRPKSIARKLIEEGMGFAAFVKSWRLERSEGVLLRYLLQASHALGTSVPSYANEPALMEVAAYLRAVVAHTDASLLQAWETLGEPAPLPDAPAAGVAPATAAARFRADSKALGARLRAELKQVVSALLVGDAAAAARAFCWPSEESQGADEQGASKEGHAAHADLAQAETAAAAPPVASFAHAVEPQQAIDSMTAVMAELGPLLATPLSHQARLTRIEPKDDGSIALFLTLLFRDETAEAALCACVPANAQLHREEPVIEFVSIAAL